MEHKEAGNVAFRDKRWQEAADHYTAALAVDPTMAAALANRAACSLQLAQYAAALEDTNTALQLNNASPQLLTKIYWRKAVALRSLGQDKLAWEACIRAGLELDASNAKLLEEQEYVFVNSVRAMPDIYTLAKATPTEAPRALAPTAPSPATTEPGRAEHGSFPVPLTYSGLLHLVRSKSHASDAFWYANVSGSDLKRALVPGVEPDMLDYIFDLIATHPGEPLRNREYFDALQASPRFETALFMADEKKHSRARSTIDSKHV